ncbi:Hypothetical predicted protein [Paramuricea clavata]|uniref:Uncharacterized protein n=1 Tax=Paramuricea clavata TaxID=317549 RepID=A0A7D9HH27_PARCT|nr:Hypothetical predicted protein [Paramuricea clavata]
MITSLGFFILFSLFWLIFLACRSFINIILSWILSQLVKKTFPHENLQITVEDFGYFCVNGVSVHIDKNRVVRIEQIVLQFLWEEFRLKLQSTAKDITLETRHPGKSTKRNKNRAGHDEVVIKASITIGINLYSFHPPTELLCIAPKTEHVHGSDIKISELTSVWLFARNAKASIQGQVDGDDAVSYEFSASGGDAFVLYNSSMARLVFLFKEANANGTKNGLNAQVAKSEGLILVYKFEDGILTSSHSQLKHTEINLSPSTINSLEDLVTRYVKDNFEDSLYKEKVSEHNEIPCTNGKLSSEDDEEKCEVAMEAESVTINAYSTENSRHFELKLAFISLGIPNKNMIRWSVSVPFELTFIDEQAGRGKESVLGSKIKSEGLVNPCVLKIDGDEISNKTTRWDVSFHEGILVEIKPKYVNALETFIKTYKSSVKHASNSSTEVFERHRNVPQADDVIDQDRIALSENLDKMSHRQEMCEISANICDITIDVKDGYDQKLLQVVMIHPKVCDLQNSTSY